MDFGELIPIAGIFGGVAMMVETTPSVEPYTTASTRQCPSRLRCSSSGRVRTTPRATGSMMTVVAVLVIHAAISAQEIMKPPTNRFALPLKARRR